MGLTMRWHFGGVFVNNHTHLMPTGRTEDEFILLWNDKVLLDVYKETVDEEVGGEAEVIDLEVVLLEGVETEACEPYAKAIDHFLKGVDVDPCSVAIEEEPEDPIRNTSQKILM
ncbi:hypothetical protein GH714_037426 [Hevea brasiliensis]|uniref:Uncharacterized protein n=1 Tax=Hevea brasiliensis TaxID=3981 RepID=A0A6A6M3E9_HEVBR|nr:hypothetical protein GH714_037426 [Hevea brasiliensis]